MNTTDNTNVLDTFESSSTDVLTEFELTCADDNANNDTETNDSADNFDTFKSFGLNPALLETLKGVSYTTPTPIQQQAIPLILQGRDILGSAQTGTGKTGAFAIPLLEILSREENSTANALILAPTRELALQIKKFITSVSPKGKFRVACLRGGESKHQQFEQLRRSPRIIVGTPGRIIDHLECNTLPINNTKFVVLDETDRMLDFGFYDQLQMIFSKIQKTRQVIMFSATMPNNMVALSKEYLNNPARIAIGSTTTISDKITQEVVRVSHRDKYKELVSQLQKREGSVVIFVRTKSNSVDLAGDLEADGFKTCFIHGDLRQKARDNTIRRFADKMSTILVATDVFARGMDIPHIQHVINYDVPFAPEEYIHRIGRTARAGAEGHSLCLVSPADERKWHDIERLISGESGKDKRGAKPGAAYGYAKKGGRGRYDSNDRDDKPRFSRSSSWTPSESDSESGDSGGSSGFNRNARFGDRPRAIGSGFAERRDGDASRVESAGRSEEGFRKKREFTPRSSFGTDSRGSDAPRDSRRGNFEFNTTSDGKRSEFAGGSSFGRDSNRSGGFSGGSSFGNRDRDSTRSGGFGGGSSFGNRDRDSARSSGFGGGSFGNRDRDSTRSGDSSSNRSYSKGPSDSFGPPKRRDGQFSSASRPGSSGGRARSPKKDVVFSS